MKNENILLFLTLSGVFGGIALGIGLKLGTDAKPTLSARNIVYLRFPGELFMRMLKMLILPLITSSLINSLAMLDSDTAGRMGISATLYYLSTTGLAVITGIILVSVIQPGNYAKVLKSSKQESDSTCKGILPVDAIMDLIRNMFPDNIAVATFQSTHSCVNYERRNENGTVVDTIDYVDWTKQNEDERMRWEAVPFNQMNDGMNILGLVVFSLIFGYVINRMGEKGRPLAKFFQSLEATVMYMVTIVIWLSPVGIFFLIATEIVKMDDLLAELQRLSMYILTVLIGHAIHSIITLPILLFFIGRRNPIRYTYGMLQALLTAFGTSSSSATMSVTLECLEQNNQIDPRVSRFVIPLGATINMDGTALYEAVAAIYIAQSVGYPLTLGKIIIISITATMASIGAAGIPQAGLVTTIMVLISVGLNPTYFTLIVSVDWFIDRIRTAVNVLGDSYGAGIVQTLCNNQLNASKVTESTDKAAIPLKERENVANRAKIYYVNNTIQQRLEQAFD